jgi:hypothetical protein
MSGIWSLTPIGAMIGVVLVVYLLIATGKLIPRSSHEREMRQANIRGDEWKETANVERAAKSILLEQNSGLIQALSVVESFLRASAPQKIPESPPSPGGNNDLES